MGGELNMQKLQVASIIQRQDVTTLAPPPLFLGRVQMRHWWSPEKRWKSFEKPLASPFTDP